MKNTIPMIIAVILAAAAVFAVSRMVKPKEGETEKQYVDVVAASQVIAPDSEIQESWLLKRKVEASSIPADAILWNQANRVVGQKSVRTIPEGDYVLLSAVATLLAPEFDMLVPEGEWAVPVTFADGALVQFLEPGMEISILGTFEMKEKIEKMDGTEKPEEVKEEATSVIFPCVRILDVGKGDGIRRERGATGGGTVIVSLTPQQAATLVAAQRTMDLYPALRRRSDRSSLKRRDVGVVNDSTFQGLKKGLEPVVLSDGAKEKNEK